jgi:ABC-type transport system involved in cytochrome bd biosynthesis fused ATPase/permease subunit
MNKYGKVSLFSAGIMFPAATFVSGLIGWSLKSSNPDNVDITQGLAYLRPILVTGFCVFGVLLAISLVSGVLALRKDADKTFGKLGLALLITIFIVSAGSAIAASKTDHAIDDYRTAKEQRFFDALKEQESKKQ